MVFLMLVLKDPFERLKKLLLLNIKNIFRNNGLQNFKFILPNRVA